MSDNDQPHKVVEKILVTKSRCLRQFLVSKGIISDEVQVFAHVTHRECEGKHVIMGEGRLPYYMSAKAKLISELFLKDVPKDKKREDLTLDELKIHYRGMQSYVVNKVE